MLKRAAVSGLAPLVVTFGAFCASACSANGGESGTKTGSQAQSTSGSATVVDQPVLNTGGSTGPDLGTVETPPEEKCEAVLKLTIRDFNPSTNPHPDFEAYQGLNDIGCGMVAPALGTDSKPVFASGIGTQKRVTMGDWEHLTFGSCAEWNGWNPDPVITSQLSFDQWYRDDATVNQTFEVDVTLVDDGTGALAYDSAAFFPIDGMGFGNTPGEEHNFHFTTEGHLKFGYVAGQKFTFRGDDDLWIFVNGKLALDLGGQHLPIAATIDFDAQAEALGIRPGGTYQMDFFHAERHTDQSNFRIETNIRCFEPVKVK
ncbi:MAG TPA: fibro-slime domain-containing protein [Polyangiaceae bacterium]|nr:fibro-slime domain-containing protein [Polyangiaceae bacterium]